MTDEPRGADPAQAAVASDPLGEPISVRRSAAIFGAGTVLSHGSQLVWLAAASRAMSPETFGTVLAAQVLYAVLQILVDAGTAALGARKVARGELTDQARGEIVRVRMALVLGAAPVALGLGLLGVSGSIEATAPFVVALVLFGGFSVWVPYGGGDARPWATYMFARSALPAATATGYVIVGASFPAPLAGALECVVLIVVMVLFGQRPLADLRLALATRSGPWRAVLSIGAPPVMAQTSMAAGTLILSGSGSPAAAGVFAACVRVLTGLNAISGTVATAMYPRLARSGRGGTSADAALVSTALRLIAAIGVTATAVCVLAGEAITTAFMDTSSSRAVTALVLTAAAALPLGNIIMFGYQLVAREHERDLLVSFALGAAATIGCGLAVVGAAGPRVDLVAGALLGGQLVSMGILARRIADRCPELAGAAARSVAIAVLVAAIVCAACLAAAALPAGLV
ncbi:MAG: lipopolysaccharide biosynthesis protein, partial [Solirubrobacteraceae bacterium]